jgi:hypothetical protein
VTVSLDWRASLAYAVIPLILSILAVRVGRGWLGIGLATVAFTMVCHYALYLASFQAVAQTSQYGWLYVIANRLPWMAVVVAAIVMRSGGVRGVVTGAVCAAVAVAAGMAVAVGALHVLRLVKLKLY